jgi:anti-sigma B factor antagonist
MKIIILRQEVTMTEKKLVARARQAGPFANVIDIEGEISTFSVEELEQAYEQAVQGNFRTVIFNFTGLTYMNSFGIGMLVRLLIHARRDNKNVVGYGLSDHYRQIFKITRLDQVIPIYENQSIALAAAEPYDHPEREA